MKRRDFLKLKFEDNLTSKINLSLDEFKGNWNFTSASHLLKRTLFGTRSSDVTSAVQRGLKKVVSDILKKESDPAPPIYPYKDESGIGYCETWHDKKPNSGFDRKMINALLFWWFGNIFNQPATITEKMILFWHNHFVTESFIVGNAFYFYSYYLLLRDQALGNFKTLTEKMTVNTAMLVYLNGNTNFAGKPNENYARELLELFTVGKGPLIAEGNYTNYTENDVLAAAKILTGWTTDRNTNSAIFKLNLHEKSDKFFSAAFQNKTIKSNGENEYKDLINLIFQQRETALHICRELYKWFVFYKITPEIESNIIEPLADILIENNFEVKPVLEKLFLSEHFYDINIIGSMIKNPVDFIAGMVKSFDVQFIKPDDNDKLVTLYGLWFSLGYNEAFKQDFILGDPPGVAGWSSYYQEPGFYRQWISSVTMQNRIQLSDSLISSKGITRYGFKLIIDPLGFTKKFEMPSIADELIKEAVRTLLPFEITDNQIKFLKDNLLGTTPDYEWNSKWQEFEANPTSKPIQDELNNKLRNLYRAVMSLAEYHLM